MSRHFDKYTADGSSRVKKPSLKNPKSVDMDEIRKADEGKVLVRIDKNTVKYMSIDKIENLRDRVIRLLMERIDGLPTTAYQLNKKTGINLTTCQQIINGTFNPTWNTLVDMEKKYSV